MIRKLSFGWMRVDCLPVNSGDGCVLRKWRRMPVCLLPDIVPMFHIIGFMEGIEDASNKNQSPGENR